MTVDVVVPANTANLGPGFDTLGMALSLYNRMRFEEIYGAVQVISHGEGAGTLETGAGNLVYRSAARVFREVGKPDPGLRITLENGIPVSRGLGSSSTAIVGGLVGANALLGSPLDEERLLTLAVEIEGHPDNVAPALLGGFQVCCLTGEGVFHVGIPSPAGLRVVVCIPDVAVSTEDARRVLPQQYSRADAVFNISRAALLVAGLLAGRPEVLRTAMQDRIHQPYRAALVPGFEGALQGALEAGAVGACLSGSGSTMLALTRDNEEAVGEAMAAAVRQAGAGARWLALDVDPQGARVVG